MVEIQDLDSYREHNDIEPDDPAPREPKGPPDAENEQFRVWLFDAEESETVPDIYVAAQDPSPLDFRMWVFVGRGETAQFSMRASHRYSEEEVAAEGHEDCCEVLFAGESLTAPHCPPAVEELASDLSGADVLLPPEREAEGDHGGPIDY
jgi:hypothetical protein